MKTLTFDTSLEKMYVAIGEDSEVKSYRIIENTKERYHSALLIPTIIELLKENNMTPQDIEAIGVNIGPGSFTGIRASSTVARVMAQNLDIPVVGVSSLEIVSMINDTDKNSLCLIDARKNKSYMAVYSPEGEIIQEPLALEYETVIDYAKNNDVFVIADNAMSEKLKANNINSINFQQSNYNFGLYLTKLTCKYIEQNNPDKYKWFRLKPLYIQPPSIIMPKAVKM